MARKTPHTRGVTARAAHVEPIPELRNRGLLAGYPFNGAKELGHAQGRRCPLMLVVLVVGSTFLIAEMLQVMEFAIRSEPGD